MCGVPEAPARARVPWDWDQFSVWNVFVPSDLEALIHPDTWVDVWIKHRYSQGWLTFFHNVWKLFQIYLPGFRSNNTKISFWSRKIDIDTRIIF